jgi:hypothetical protein
MINFFFLGQDFDDEHKNYGMHINLKIRGKKITGKNKKLSKKKKKI